jgi:hypothetical protein
MTAPAVSSPGFPRRHARMGRYALWQTSDFVINTAIITIILFGLLGFLSVMQIHTAEQYYGMRHPPQPMPLQAKLNIFLQIYGIFATVAPIICLSGIVSQDRTSGYTRFLFAKPVSPRWFYTQSLLIRLAGFLVIGHALLFWYGLYEPPAYTSRFLVDMLVTFASIGGVVFLLSVISKFDGLVSVVVLLVSAIVWGKWETATGFKHALTYLLPPVEKSGDLHQWVLQLNTMGSIGEVAFPTKWALWSAGYGLACMVLGLYLLRKIPLTKT